MPWYYAGPEAKPVGPVSLEELHARRLSGAIQPETYIIEDTGAPDPARAWRRYREVFPAIPNLPPIPQAAFQPPPPPPVQVPPPPTPTHVLPPPATPSYYPPPVAASHPHPHLPPPAPGPHYLPASGPTPPVNSWCAWALGLGVASPFLIPFCFLGTLMALGSIFMGFGGMAQIHGHPGQSGRVHAIFGILASLLALLLSVVIIIFLAHWSYQHAQQQITTEQTSNDSE